MSEQIPGSWSGKDVLLARNGAADSERVTLKEVNDTGLAYTYKEGEIGDEPVFVPWSSVSWMRPLVARDNESHQEEEE